MYRYLFVLFWFLGIALDLKGQADSIKVDKTVYLKDGSVLKGEIIEDNDFAVTLVIFSGDTLVIGYKHINSVGADLLETNQRYIRKPRKPQFHKTEGLFVTISSGIILSQDEPTAQLSVIGGKRINENLLLGAGVGVFDYTKVLSNYYMYNSYAALTGYGRYYFNTDKTKYYTALRLGYGLSLDLGEEFPNDQNNHYDGGVTGQVSLGVHFASRRKWRFLVEANLGYQKTSGRINTFDWNQPNWTNFPITIEYDITFIRPGISVGIEF